jgi:hypothetical protein
MAFLCVTQQGEFKISKTPLKTEDGGGGGGGGLPLYPSHLLFVQVALKRKPDGRRRGWFLGGQTNTRVGQFCFFLIVFLIVFCNSPHREMPKNVIKTNEEKNEVFWQKLFDTIFL